MKIRGLVKTSLLDYPGKVAATIFLGGCNYSCPYCHNAGLESQPKIKTKTVLDFLKKRKSVLEGVCISGGEPTIHYGLVGLIRSIRELGYPVKLDTNGTNPDMVRFLVADGLVQKVAMDIKSGRGSYDLLAGTKSDLSSVMETADYLTRAPVEYEFRTTAVKGLHTLDDFEDIAVWLASAKNYFIQPVVSDVYKSFSDDELDRIVDILSRTVENVCIRGR